MAPLPQVRGWAIVIGVNSKSRPFATGSYVLTATVRRTCGNAKQTPKEFGNEGMKGASQKRRYIAPRSETQAAIFNRRH